MKWKYDLSDPYDRMKFREFMLPDWNQKKYRSFVKQMEEYAPYGDGMTDLLLGLCYQHGWGVWKNKDTARQYFSRLHVGKTVWFGHYISFMECEVIKIEEDRVLLREKKPRVMYSGYGRDLLFPPKESAPWDQCLARKWMNTDYYKDTFYKQERDLILKVKITTPDNPYTGAKYAGKECEDKVFPLSLQEYLEYMGWTNKIPMEHRITVSREGPEAVAVRAGEYVTRITTRTYDYRFLNYGLDIDCLVKANLKQIEGTFFRTPGNSPESKAFELLGFVCPEGETGAKLQLVSTKIGYQPAFWVSLK